MKLGGPELSFKDLLINRLEFLDKTYMSVGLYNLEKFKAKINNNCEGIDAYDLSLKFEIEKPNVVTISHVLDDKKLDVEVTDDILREYFDELSNKYCRNKVNEHLKREKEQEWQNKITIRMEEEDLI